MTVVSNHQIFIFKTSAGSFEAHGDVRYSALSAEELGEKTLEVIEQVDFVQDQYFEFHFKTPMDIRFRPNWGFTRYIDLNEEEKEKFWEAIRG
ncbi:MAG: hypothetical protein WBK28_00110 [Minisyncoccia bacterium]